MTVPILDHCVRTQLWIWRRDESSTVDLYGTLIFVLESVFRSTPSLHFWLSVSFWLGNDTWPVRRFGMGLLHLLQKGYVYLFSSKPVKQVNGFQYVLPSRSIRLRWELVMWYNVIYISSPLFLDRVRIESTTQFLVSKGLSRLELLVHLSKIHLPYFVVLIDLGFSSKGSGSRSIDLPFCTDVPLMSYRTSGLPTQPCSISP